MPRMARPRSARALLSSGAGRRVVSGVKRSAAEVFGCAPAPATAAEHRLGVGAHFFKTLGNKAFTAGNATG